MSATNRGGERIDQDFYPTPAWCVHRLLEKLPLPRGRFFEPFAGDGSIIRAVNEVVPHAQPSWWASELRTEAQSDLLQLVEPTRLHIGDTLLDQPFGEVEPFDVCITNPPFSLAIESLEMALMRCQTVAFLLRVNFLGSGDRAEFWQMFPPDLYILPNRPSFFIFTKDSYKCPRCKKVLQVPEGAPPPGCARCLVVGEYTGKKQTHSDATEYAWFVYDAAERRRSHGKLVVLNTTPKAIRAAAVEGLRKKVALQAA